jgi:hypothetical protein
MNDIPIAVGADEALAKKPKWKDGGLLLGRKEM